MKTNQTQKRGFILRSLLICALLNSAVSLSAITIVGWDFTSLNSTLGSTGIAISSVQTNPSPTQTPGLSGGLYGSFKRVSSSADGTFEINFSGVSTVGFTITSLSMDINSSGAIALGGNFQVQMKHASVNSGQFTSVGNLIPYGFDATTLTVNFSSDLTANTQYNDLAGVEVKILFTVFGPNSKTIKIDNLLLSGTSIPTAIKKVINDEIIIGSDAIRNPNHAEIMIFNTMGKLILKSNEDINKSSLTKGVYIIKTVHSMSKITIDK